MGHANSIGTAAHTTSSGGGGGSDGATRPATAIHAAAALVASPTRPPPLSEEALPGSSTATTAQSLAAEQAAELREALGRLVEVLAVVNPPPAAGAASHRHTPTANAPAAAGKEEEEEEEEHVRHADAPLRGAEHPPCVMEETGEFVPSSPVSTALTDASADRAAALLLLEPFHELHLAGYRLGGAALTAPNSAAVPSFLHVLRQHTGLRVLDLSFNLLTPAIIAPLLDAVKDLPALVVLKLSGNALGTTTTNAIAAAGEGAAVDDATAAHDAWDLTTVEVQSPTSSASPAAQLGRWLAANPPLQQLALFHCGLTDGDVRLLLAGLIAPRNTNLHTLQLAWNPSCTTRSARMALQLVTKLGNTTLTTVELETVAPATSVRLEYACTPEGVFRSGHTLLPADVADADAMPVTEADPVDLAQLRTLQQQLPTLPSRLAPARAARYAARCRFLSVDLDGTRVFTPLVTRELADVLGARPRPWTASELDRTTTGAEPGQDGRTAPSPAISVASPSGAPLESAAAAASVPDADADDSDTVDDVPEVMQDVLEDGHLPAVAQAATDDETAATAADAAAGALTPTFAGLHPHPPGNDCRPRTSPPLHLRRDRLVSMSSRGSGSRAASRTSSAAAYHRFHYKRQPSVARSPQEVRDARFEAPQRLAGVMADAAAFRDRQHPHDRDPLAPPCAEVSRRNRAHGGHGPATPFFEADAFVLRANGLTKVLVAPVRPNGAMPYHNVDLEDVPDRRLRACWCTPRQTSSMTGMFAGTLHYHCVHEGTAAAMQQQQDQQRRGKAAGGGSGSGSVRRSRASPSPAGSPSRYKLPSLRGKKAPKSRKGVGFAAAGGTANATTAAAAAAAAPGAATAADTTAGAAAAAHTEGSEKVYRGCQGTGHGCLSRGVAAAEIAHGYRGRMRATLRAAASLPSTSSDSEREAKGSRAAAAGSRPHSQRRPPPQQQPDRTRGHFLDWAASDDDENDAANGGAAADALPMKVRTVHTTSSGVAVSVNYNPVAHFSAPHVSAADGMTLAEF